MKIAQVSLSHIRVVNGTVHHALLWIGFVPTSRDSLFGRPETRRTLVSTRDRLEGKKNVRLALRPVNDAFGIRGTLDIVIEPSQWIPKLSDNDSQGVNLTIDPNS